MTTLTTIALIVGLALICTATYSAWEIYRATCRTPPVGVPVLLSRPDHQPVVSNRLYEVQVMGVWYASTQNDSGPAIAVKWREK